VKPAYENRGVPLAWLAPPEGLLRALLEEAPEIRSLVPRLPRGPEEIVEALISLSPPAADSTVNEIVGSLEALGAPAPARANAELLGREGTMAVVTGQQPGLLGGPLYTFLKAAGTVRAAGALTAAERARGSSRRWVPVFWNASEDHDLDEVNGVVLPDDSGRPRRVRAGIRADGRACRDVSSETPILDAFLDEAEAMAPAGPHRAAASALLRETRGGSIASWFSRIYLRLLGEHGLVVMEPDHVREATRPLMERELLEPGRLTRAVTRGGEAMRAAGLEPVLATEREVNLFITHEGRRRALRRDGPRFVIEGTTARHDLETLRRRIAEDPKAFSTNVALRPLVQDAALPVGVQLAGPTELAYLAELAVAHEDAGVPRPRVLPRPAGTLVETPVSRALRGLELSAATLLTDPDRLEARIPPSAEEEEFSARFGRVREGLLPEVEDLAANAGPDGSGSRRKARRLLRHLRANLDRLERTVVETRRAERGVGRARIETIENALRPLGRPQERVYGLWPFLDRHGLDLAERLHTTIDPFAFDHKVIRIV